MGNICNRHTLSQKRDKKGTSKRVQNREIIAEYCYQYKSWEEQSLLVEGYVQQYYKTRKIIAIDIIETCIKMIGKFTKNRYEWFINGNDLKKIISNPTDTDIILENNPFDVYGLRPFEMRVSIEILEYAESLFEMRFCAPTEYFNPLHHSEIRCTSLGSKYDYFATLFIAELGNGLNYKMIDDSTMKVPFSKIIEKGLSALHGLHFGVIIDINYIITKFNMRTLQAMFYYNNCIKTKMSTNFNVEWILKKKDLLEPSNHYLYYGKLNPLIYRETFYSECIDNNNWMMRMDKIRTHENESLSLYLQLLKWPFGFYETIKVKISAQMTVTTNKTEEIQMSEIEITFKSPHESMYEEILQVNINNKSMEVISVQLNAQTTNIYNIINHFNDEIIDNIPMDEWSWQPAWDDNELNCQFIDKYDQIFDNSCILHVTHVGKIDINTQNTNDNTNNNLNDANDMSNNLNDTNDANDNANQNTNNNKGNNKQYSESQLSENQFIQCGFCKGYFPKATLVQHIQTHY